MQKQTVKNILVQSQEQTVKNYFELIRHLFPLLSDGGQTESFDKYAMYMYISCVVLCQSSRRPPLTEDLKRPPAHFFAQNNSFLMK